MLKHIIFIIILLFGSYFYWTTRPVTHGPGVVAPSEPSQREALGFGIETINYKTYDIKPLAEIDIEARVLSKKKYSDQYAEVLPYDFVLGWGPMSDERNLDKILIRQSDRFFEWEMITRPIPRPQMIRHSANAHLAPSDQTILGQLRDVRLGQVVRIKGYLVKIDSESGWSIKSSLERDDYGKKGSEVIWIKEFQIL